MARTAEVKKDARIGEAEAKRDSTIKEALAEEERMAARYQWLHYYPTPPQCAQSGKNYEMWDFGLKLLIKTSKGSAIKF